MITPRAGILVLGLVAVCASPTGLSAQQAPARPAPAVATSDQIEAALTRLIAVRLTDSASAQPLRATLAAAEAIPVKSGDLDAAKRRKTLVETGRYQLESWEALTNWLAADKEWRAKPGTVAEKGPPPVYTPPPKPGEKVAAPPPPVEVDRFDAVADAKNFALYRELDCLDTGLTQMQIIRATAAQYGEAKGSETEICPIVSRCEGLTGESLARQLAIRDDLPMLSAAVRKCDGVAADAPQGPVVAEILRRIARLSTPEEVNRLRTDYLAARMAIEPPKVASASAE